MDYENTSYGLSILFAGMMGIAVQIAVVQPVFKAG
jgi:hypothetical protein